MKIIDLSYKKTAIHTTYDIESMYDLFTIASINENGLRLILFGNEKFEDLTDAKLKNQIYKFMKNNQKELEDAFDKSIDKLNIDVRLYSTLKPDELIKLRSDLQTMFLCNAFYEDLEFAQSIGQNVDKTTETFSEYRGWNSSNYDLPLLIMCYLLMRKRELTNIKPSDFRWLSDILISFNSYPSRLFDYVMEKTNGEIASSAFKTHYNLALWKDGHIDWARVIQMASESEANETILPSPLKREMGKLGMDIIIDENVVNGAPLEWSDEDKETLVEYNFNDILGTHLIGNRNGVKGSLETKDNLIEEYKYVSARNTPMDKIHQWTPNSRDETPAKLSSLVLVGERRIRPTDYDEVSFIFPLPNKDGELVEQDLLEYMKEKENYMHEYFYVFFDHFRGKNTQSRKDDYKVKKSQPITHKQIINIPYFRDNKPIDCYASVSTGGCHGNICAGLSKLNEKEVNNWIVADKGALAEQKPTIDLKNIIHLDFASFYPTMSHKLKMYLTSDGIDRYVDIINKRLEIKNSLPYDKSTWTKEDILKNNSQNSYKLVLNSATGAGNQHQEWGLLPLDNKILSMRLIGNMLIYCLAQRFAESGGFILSTNTDGIYVANVSYEKSKEIVEKYIDDYAMPVDPEIVDRFINRDASNRIEYVGKNRQNVSGILRHGNNLTYSDRSIGSNVTYPLIAAYSVLEYMNDEDWLKKPYDKNRLKEIIKSHLSKDNLEAFYHIHIGTRKRRLYINGKMMQRINRLILTKDGIDLSQISSRQLTVSNMCDLWNHHLSSFSTKGLEFDDVDEVKWSGALENKTNISDLILMRKVKQGREEYYLEVNIPKKEYTLDEFKELKKEYDFSYMGLKDDARIVINDETNEEQLYDIEPLSKWKEGVLTNYPNNAKGELINLKRELENFDISKIDIDQYLEWAENLLETWKVTANIEEIGLEKVDDTVVVKKTKKRLTKKEKAINRLKEIYKISTEVN